MTKGSTTSRGVWSDDEHERFVEALQKFPNGPWKAVADFVGTRTVRQVQTHALKYQEKAARRLRDLLQTRDRLPAPEPAIESEMKQICEMLQQNRVPLSPRSAELQQRSVEQLASDGDTCDGPTFDECIDFLIQTLEANAVSDGEAA